MVSEFMGAKPLRFRQIFYYFSNLSILQYDTLSARFPELSKVLWTAAYMISKFRICFVRKLTLMLICYVKINIYISLLYFIS